MDISPPAAARAPRHCPGVSPSGRRQTVPHRGAADGLRVGAGELEEPRRPARVAPDALALHALRLDHPAHPHFATKSGQVYVARARTGAIPRTAARFACVKRGRAVHRRRLRRRRWSVSSTITSSRLRETLPLAKGTPLSHRRLPTSRAVGPRPCGACHARHSRLGRPAAAGASVARSGRSGSE